MGCHVENRLEGQGQELGRLTELLPNPDSDDGAQARVVIMGELRSVGFWKYCEDFAGE